MRKKTAIRAMLMYTVLTAGIWMFLYAYSNSYNRLTEDKIAPASLTVTETAAHIQILTWSRDVPLDAVSVESPLILAAYLLTPIELRGLLILLP